MRCRGRAVPSRRCTDDSYWVSIKTHKPIASVAALTAQPLAALPPYGCGVPLAGSERLWQLQVSRHFRRAYRLSSLSLRGGRRPTWQSRSTRLHRGKATGEIATAFPRLPRRFAPRNDNSGAIIILMLACSVRRCSAGRGMPRPYNAQPETFRFYSPRLALFFSPEIWYHGRRRCSAWRMCLTILTGAAI